MSVGVARDAVARVAPELLSPSAADLVGNRSLNPALADGGDSLDSSGTLTDSIVAKDPTDGFAVTTPDGPISLAPLDTSADAAAVPTIVNGAAALSANLWPSTDAITRPTALGATTALSLRSSDAPTSFSWEVGTGPDQRLAQLDNGSIAVTDPTVTPETGATPVGWDAFTDPLLLNDPSLTEPSPDTAAAAADSSATIDEDTGGVTGPDGQIGDDEIPPDPGDGVQIAPYDSSSENAPPPAPHGNAPAMAAPVIETRGKGALATDPADQHHGATAALARADTQTGQTTLAVIGAPRARDANGKSVPTTLTADGDVVTLTVAAGSRSAFPIVVASSTVAGTARGRKVHYGLSDQRAEHFGPIDDRLVSGPLHVEFARLVIPWNTRPGDEKLDAWLRAVRSDGLEPDITLGPGTISPRSPGEYYAGITRLMRFGPTKTVHYWGAWNEPDFKNNSTAHDAALAARYWGVARKAARSYCKTCTIIAGEFSGDATAAQHAYIAAYKTQIKRMVDVHTLPKVWSLHAYYDLINSNTRYSNPTTKYFVQSLGADVRYPRVWLTEQGVELRTGHRDVTRLWGHPDRQRLASLDFLRLASTPGTQQRIDHVFYYHYQADPLIPGKRSPFDSGLLNSAGKARPAYCVLAYATHQCPAQAADYADPDDGAPPVNITPPTISTETWCGDPAVYCFGHIHPGTWTGDPTFTFVTGTCSTASECSALGESTDPDIQAALVVDTTSSWCGTTTEHFETTVIARNLYGEVILPVKSPSFTVGCVIGT